MISVRRQGPGQECNLSPWASPTKSTVRCVCAYGSGESTHSFHEILKVVSDFSGQNCLNLNSLSKKLKDLGCR